MNTAVRVIAAAFACVAVLSAIALAAWFLIFPDRFSNRFDDVDLVAVNTAVGVFLIAAGLALAVVGYACGVVLNVAPKKADEDELTAAGTIDFPDAIKNLTDLLKQAGGLGIAVLLLGVILLTGTALGDAASTGSTSGDSEATSSPRRTS
jgi:hypothetical protein